jgi:hypothetical protein
MRDVVFGGAEHYLRLIAVRHLPKVAEEFISIHHRHVPVEQHRIGQLALADLKGLLAVLGFDKPEVETFQYTPGNFADDA